MTGQSLINAAELRSITTEFQQYQTALQTFKGKYFALPGDMPNATSFWGRADNGSFSGQCANPAINGGTGTQTCNGNGDGRIREYGTLNEYFKAWQHLANASLINGRFTGLGGSGDPDWQHIIGQSSPASKFPNGGWSFFTADSTHTNWFSAMFNKTILQIGAQAPAWEPSEPLLTTEEAWNIDTKMDDGKPGLGFVISQNPNYTPCATSTDGNTAIYNLNNSSVACQLIFILN